MAGSPEKQSAGVMFEAGYRKIARGFSFEEAMEKHSARLYGLLRYVSSGRAPARDDSFGDQFARNLSYLSNDIHALNRVLTRPERSRLDEFLDLWERESQGRLGEFSDSGHATALSGYGKLDLRPEKEWLDRWYAASAATLHAWHPDRVALVCGALKKLELTPPPFWMAKFFSGTEHRLAEFSPRALGTVMTSVSGFNADIPSGWLGNWLDAAHNLPATVDCPAASLYALTSRGIDAGASWLADWQASAQNNLERFDARQTANALHALSVAHAMHPERPIDRGLVEALLTRAAAMRVSSEGKKQCAHTAAVFDLSLPPSLRLSGEAMRLLENQNGVTGLERDFRAYLNRALPKDGSVTVETEVWHPGSQSSVDLVLRRRPSGRDPGAALVVQLDGPTHYGLYNGRRQPDGRTILNTHLIEKNCRPNEALLRVDHLDFNRDRDASVRDALSRLDHLGREAPKTDPKPWTERRPAVGRNGIRSLDGGGWTKG